MVNLFPVCRPVYGILFLPPIDQSGLNIDHRLDIEICQFVERFKLAVLRLLICPELECNGQSYPCGLYGRPYAGL